MIIFIIIRLFFNLFRHVSRDLITFAINHDDLAKKIADRGREFIWNNLRMSDVTHFWKQLLKSYGKLLKYKPVLKSNLIKIGKGR